MPSGNSSGRSNCSNRKNPCVSSSSGVALRSSTCRPSAAIGAIARYPARLGARRAPQTLGLVNDEQVDARRDCLSGELRPFNQRLECDHRAAMRVEWVEAGAEVARDVGQAQRIEEREHLMVLAPQLAQPLHRQRLGHDDQAALDSLRVQQAGS